jgi:hypothetical protein
VSQSKDELQHELFAEASRVGIAQDKIGVRAEQPGAAIREIEIQMGVLDHHPPTPGARRAEL